MRGILRRVKTPELPKELAAKKDPPLVNAIRPFVLTEYRRARQQEASVSSSNANDHQLSIPDESLAKTYLQLKADLDERARLYELDSGAEVVLSPKEQSRRAAARAGLQLPKLDTFDDDELDK